MVTWQSVEYMRLYSFYTKGVLVFGGGLYDQPNVYIEAMHLIDSRSAKLRAERNG